MYVLKQRKYECHKSIPILQNRKKNESDDKKVTIPPVDPVAVCLLYFLIRCRTSCYQNTITGLTRQLVQAAGYMGIDPCRIPAAPGMLSARLEILETELNQMLGINITICRVNGSPRSVRIFF